MYLDNKTLEIHNGVQCKWCDKRLTWINHFANSVCSTCHDLMVNAGLHPNEIFGAVSRVDPSSLTPLVTIK